MGENDLEGDLYDRMAAEIVDGCINCSGGGLNSWEIANLQEAMARTLRAHFIVAMAALEPFAAAVDEADGDEYQDNDDAWETSLAMAVKVGDFRRAYRARSRIRAETRRALHG